MKQALAAFSCAWQLTFSAIILAAQPSSVLPEDEIKAALILGFVRYSEWPESKASAGGSQPAPTVVGVQGRPSLTRALTRALAGKSAGGRPLAARDVLVPADALQCNVLFLAGVNRSQLAEWISPLHGLPVLTVGESSLLHPLGGIVQLFEEDGKIRFAVSIDALSRSRISVSAKLLRLGEIVHGKGN